MKENKILKVIIVILIIINQIICFKGLKLKAENRELKEEIKVLQNYKFLEENYV